MPIIWQADTSACFAKRGLLSGSTKDRPRGGSMQRIARPLALIIALCCMSTSHSLSASSACEAQLESSFFNRTILEKGLLLNQVSQSSWYLIYLELSRRTPQIHQLVERYTREENQGTPPPKTSAERQERRARAVDRALFQILSDVLVQYQVSENVPQNVYDYLKSQQRAKLVACYGPYFSTAPQTPQNKEKAVPPGDQSRNFELIEQRKEARMYAYDMRLLLRKYNIAPSIPPEGTNLDLQHSNQAKEGIFELYEAPKLMQSK